MDGKTLRISLFGKLSIERGQHQNAVAGLLKAQELLCFLLLHRHRLNPRELLAATLWADHPPARARQYLRKALWQLQSALGGASPPLLRVERNAIRIDASADVWVDVHAFADALAAAEGTPGRGLDPAAADALDRAVRLYRGALLEGWSQEWCLVEREHFELMYLGALDKLVSYCEHRHEYERGLEYGLRVLSRDPARERSHRAIMRLHYLAGDRTSALRQFRRCAEALKEELNVDPSPQTLALFERIRAGSSAAGDRAAFPSDEPSSPDGDPGAARAELQGLAMNLQQIEREIHALRLQLSRHMEAAGRNGHG